MVEEKSLDRETPFALSSMKKGTTIERYWGRLQNSEAKEGLTFPI
jgi:hypothetical protein